MNGVLIVMDTKLTVSPCAFTMRLGVRTENREKPGRGSDTFSGVHWRLNPVFVKTFLVSHRPALLDIPWSSALNERHRLRTQEKHDIDHRSIEKVSNQSESTRSPADDVRNSCRDWPQISLVESSFPAHQFRYNDIDYKYKKHGVESLFDREALRSVGIATLPGR